MIGQKELINKLDSYNIDTFPRSVIVIGEKGMGKHTLAEHISKNVLMLPTIDLTELISNEYLDAIYRNTNPNIYVIDTSKITEKSQNTLLKFLEEPPASAFIILLAENTNFLLNTIVNRCISFYMLRYSKEELSQFIPESCKEESELFLQLFNTPGDMINAANQNIHGLCELCDKIINKLSVATYPNTLSIVNKINVAETYEKYDLKTFLSCLSWMLFTEYKDTLDNQFLTMYHIVNDCWKELAADTRINKEIFVKKLLTRLWKNAHKEN